MKDEKSQTFEAFENRLASYDRIMGVAVAEAIEENQRLGIYLGLPKMESKCVAEDDESVSS